MLEDLLAQLRQTQAELGDADPSGIAATFELSWQSLRDETKTLGALLSLFGPAPIPRSLLEQVLDFDEEAEPLITDVDAAIDELLKKFLLLVTRPNTYALHDLMRDSLRQKLEDMNEGDALKRLYCRSIAAVASEMSYGPTLAKIEEFIPLIPHILEAATTLQAWLADEDLVLPANCLGRFYEGQSAFDQAEEWYEHTLNSCRQRLGEEHPAVATSLNNLAALYDKQGRYSEAEPLYQQALALSRRLLGEEHPGSLNNLATLYANQGRYSEAEPLYQQALALRRRLLGEEHPDVATSLNNLALLYDNQGRYSEAEPLYQQALALSRRLLGEEHPDVALSVWCLGTLRYRQGRLDEAKALLLKALPIYETKLGHEHPSTQNLRRWLDAVQQALGEGA